MYICVRLHFFNKLKQRLLLNLPKRCIHSPFTRRLQDLGFSIPHFSSIGLFLFFFCSTVPRLLPFPLSPPFMSPSQWGLCWRTVSGSACSHNSSTSQLLWGHTGVTLGSEVGLWPCERACSGLCVCLYWMQREGCDLCLLWFWTLWNTQCFSACWNTQCFHSSGLKTFWIDLKNFIVSGFCCSLVQYFSGISSGFMQRPTVLSIT